MGAIAMAGADLAVSGTAANLNVRQQANPRVDHRDLPAAIPAMFYFSPARASWANPHARTRETGIKCFASWFFRLSLLSRLAYRQRMRRHDLAHRQNLPEKSPRPADFSRRSKRAADLTPSGRSWRFSSAAVLFVNVSKVRLSYLGAARSLAAAMRPPSIVRIADRVPTLGS